MPYADDTDRVSISEVEIRAQLVRILGFPGLQSSNRRRQMLTYVVEEAIAGRASRLKGASIATAVFGRGSDFDQQSDPVVRLEARKLRRDLDNYYAGVGRHDPVRIDIPKGGYVPAFNYQSDPLVRLGDPPVEPAVVSGRHAAEARRWHREPWRLFTVGAAVIALIVVFVSFLLADQGKGVPVQATKGSVLVSGFRALDKSEHTALIAEGVTQELVSNLLRFAHLRVYFLSDASRSERAATEDEADLPPTQFEMTGTVGRDGDAYVIKAQLTLKENRQILWTDTFTDAASAKSLTRVQNEVAAQIATVVGQQYGAIQNTLHEAAFASGVDPSLDSYICVARALVYRRTIEKEKYEPTRACLELAVKRDPDYADAWAMLAHLRFDAARFGRDPELTGNEGLYSAKEAAERALVNDPKNIEAYKVLSFVEEYLGNFDAAISMAEHAVELNPNAPDALANLGNRLCFRGRFEEGVPLLKRALDRLVKPIPFYYQMIAVSHMMKNEWEEMLEAASRAVADNSGPSFALLAIAHGGLGNSRLAQENLDAMAGRSPILAQDPKTAFERYRLDSLIVDALVDGLEMARAVASEGV